MKYKFIGKNITVTPALEAQATKKLSKLEKFFNEDLMALTATITFSVVKLDQIIEVTIPLKKRLLRAEVKSSDMYASIDQVVDILESQLKKYKSRLRDRARKDNNFKEELAQSLAAQNEDDSDTLISIEKMKKFAVKPMDAEEAVMEMELLGHDFYVFKNAQTDIVNVIYKRKSGSYGLIEPE